MAGRFSRTYSRKRPQPATPISQFDALVKEGSSLASNQPAATKTAGHLGKWGITSFTSLRAINGGKEEGYKRSYSGGADSPGTSPSHSSTDAYGSVSHNNGESLAAAATTTLIDKPVVTYKRRKFFKSRGAPDEAAAAAAEGQSSSGVSSGGGHVNAAPNEGLSSNSKNTRDVSRDFDSLLASDHNNGSSRSSHARQTITLPSTLPESRSPSPPSVLPSIAVENKPVSTGIKLKIFKSRSSESSWVQDQYSSRVELPSDDSKSSTDSSSVASSPSSVDVNGLEKEASVPEKKIVTSNSRYPCRTRGGASSVSAHTLPPSAGINLEMSSQSSIDSTLPLSSTSCEDRALHDSLSSSAVEDEANINASLDSSAEFGEIIDQRTGLPISMYNRALTDTSLDVSGVVSSPIPPKLGLSAASNVPSAGSVPSLSSKKFTHTYTKNVSKSREINKYLNKNSQALSRDSDDKLVDTLPNSYLENDKVENSTSAVVSEADTLTESSDKCDRIAPLRFSARSYGSRTKSSASSTVLNSVGSKTKNSLDVRNSIASNSFINSKPSTSSSSLDYNSLDCKSVNTTNVIAAPSTQTKSIVPDLFSSGFDEEEIIDRTLVDYSSPAVDSGAESNGVAEENTQEMDAGSGDACDLDLSTKASTSSQSIEEASTSAAGARVEPLRKCSSLPTRNLLRSMSSSLAPEGSASSSNAKSAALPRKRSIFKSRVEKEDGGSSKKRATYNHKWHSSNEDKDEEGDSYKSASSSGGSAAKSTGSSQEYSAFDDFDFDGGGGATLKRVQSWSAQSSSAPLPDVDETTDAGSKVTSVKCNKGAKQYYTVIKNVKKLHQLQESGEFQEFNDDVEYFLDALRSTNSASTRCLAALNLAHKCMVPAFRMHLRAHATVCKFFRALQDAPKHPGLSLCSAMVMFALSQDRLNMDLDRDSLELMLNLLDSDGASSGGAGSGAAAGGSANGANPAMAEAVAKIRDLCRQLQKKGHAKHLDLDSIDTGTLAMETLLSLTSKRAGEWFKEELRELGGVDHLVRTVTGCVRPLLSSASDLQWTPRTTDTFSKVERCLKVLENVTHQNESNQDYLLQFQSGVFASTLMDLFSLCHEQVPLTAAQAASTPEDKPAESSLLTSPTSIKIILPKSPPPSSSSSSSTPGAKKKHAVASGPLRRKEQVLTPLQSVSSALITSMKVLVNLTHNSRKLGLGSKTFGAQARTYNITLRCLLVLPQHLLPETRFEVQVLSCCLLLNLVEHSMDNRAALMRTKAPVALDDEDDHDIFSGPAAPPPHGAMRALVSLFYSCEASAREHEAHTDQIIDRDLDQTARRQRPAKEEGGSKEDDLEETVARLLQKAGRHMEDTLIAAYTALLTGYCIMDNKECEEVVRALQPEGHFRSMVTVLKKFLHFMDLTATTSLLRSLKPTERVVKYMEKLDPPLEPAAVTVAERERLKQNEDEEEDDFDESFGQEPSDSLVDAFGF